MPYSFSSQTRYTVSMVMELTGLTARQIRYYEKLGHVAPERSSGNQRLFTPSDLAILQDMADLKRQGHSLSLIRTILASRQAARNRDRSTADSLPDELAMQNALIYFKSGRQD